MSNMFQEIIAFIISTTGWVLVSSTLPTDYWQVSSNDGDVITTATYWANLWKVCVTDSTGVSSCKDFPSMLALNGIIQACRGLMITAVFLGFFGSIFALVGLKCTKIGGTDKNKARITCFAEIFVCNSISSCSIYAHRITSEFFDPTFIDKKYELGAALFIGWAGSILCILGGSMLCAATHSHISPYPRGHAKSVNPRPTADCSNSSRTQHFDKNIYV
uniref:Claudin n=1 Tax=Monopterus albus TaxID=43700 RepID=A0A3Q3JBF1_MONAL